jgi:hypothetical protein
MKLLLVPCVVASLALSGLALLRPAAPAEGAKVDYRFSTAPVNALGLKSLAELRGKPVLVDFWGTR